MESPEHTLIEWIELGLEKNPEDPHLSLMSALLIEVMQQDKSND